MDELLQQVTAAQRSAPNVSSVLLSAGIGSWPNRLVCSVSFPGFLFFLCSLTCCLAPAPLKLRPYGAVQICSLLLLLLLWFICYCRNCTFALLKGECTSWLLSQLLKASVVMLVAASTAYFFMFVLIDTVHRMTGSLENAEKSANLS